jgi:putative redox protein
MAENKAVVRQVQGITFAGRADSNHWIVMDGLEKLGGSNAGARPKELILIALGGCTGSDVVSILQKKRSTAIGCEITLTANVREEQPRVFTDIHIEYAIFGDGVKPQDVERAIELSTTTYCAVSAMLKATVTLTHSYRIEPAGRFNSAGTPVKS